MRITDLLNKDVMIMSLKATTKEAAIDEMIASLKSKGKINDEALFKEEIMKREAQSSTGIGEGIAMPHAKTKAVNEPTVVFAKSESGLDYNSLDGQPSHLFFMIAATEGANATHLETLAALSRLLVHPTFVQNLKDAKTPEEVIALFNNEQEETVDTPTSSEDTGKSVVAVTACPTGIAHTYMAAEKLQETASKLGVKIKVETNGSRGVENRLTDQEIAEADGVIIAADVQVDMPRFDGKHLIATPVAAGIHKPEELINEAISGKAPIYKAEEGSETTSSEDGLSIGQQIYKHLMSGVSHMLPFVIGGGIAIAIAFMLDQLIGVPQDQLAKLGSYNEIPALLKQIGDVAFGFMLPVFAGYIAYSISDRPGLVAGFVAGGVASVGGAGFLGALVGGFLAGYAVELVKLALKKLPKTLDGIKVVLFYPVLSVLIVGLLMLLLNVPMSALNTWLNDFLNGLSGANAVALGLLLGAMMAADLGGPINKAAYIFATGTLAASVATGGSAIMAATMAAGMVPPLATFVATLVFKNKFTPQERDAGLTNSILGASFITEGAIPFAAADPLRMIPSFIAGSAITGAIVMFLNIKVLAPHGGVFVIFLVSQPWFYIIAIVIGTLISAALIGFLRKKPTI
ncbi:PTS fructose transporter subunit IIABC [Listeria seeligeri]|uniref:PTS fructose transporter subunit IIABC n=1 Tax=Listeria seeligeri TaxID=1640 RepID=UPI0010F1F80B|nr:fructose-specific PTS transporter subunit EIIC [Listeria seeligeri]MBC1730383.1 PTS transporter subunit EIIA [Listeria seeligeri]MBC1808185.1 PTS transporter subunit EIIA [Listeria seeligeri]MBC1893338.1 PTS transporter subunit EIIA [Listeria seeligeri]MBC1900279.1 PTS transporter subunit EIIA [Listeria seeligeri]MBC1994437.1 PTS transporter subunit EIIA [Listeria seeligeri]